MIKRYTPHLVLNAALLLNAACQSSPGSGSTPATSSAASTPVGTGAGSQPAVAAPPAASSTASSGAAAPSGSASAAPSAPMLPTQSAAILLSSSWAQSHLSADPGQEANARRLEQEGYALYKKRKDKDAVGLYEQALSQQTSAGAYYKYGNSLSNVDRIPESVTAYERALEVGFPSPEVVHYNIACSYSRLKKANEAFASLSRAVAEGYGALDKLKTDPDLAYLRSHPDWEAKSSKFVATPTQLSGKLVVYEERDMQLRYSICPDGRVFRERMVGVDESCCDSVLSGTLSKQGDQYVANWSQVCGRKGTGGPKYEFRGEGECVPYKGCAKDEECRAYKEREDVVRVSDLAGITQKTLGPPGEPGDAVFVPAKGGAAAPALCSKSAGK